MNLAVLLAATGFAAGVAALVVGLRPASVEESVASRGRSWSLPAAPRLLGAILAAAVVGLLSQWPVGVIGGAVAGAAVPSLASARRRRHETIAKVESIAAWCEQLRDIIGASSGLGEAITASSRVAPTAIRHEVRALAVDQRRLSFGSAAHRFAAAVDDPIADQVAIALTLASERRGQSLAAVLDDVARAAREEATMLDRTETARARSYNEALAVTGIVLVMFVGMLTLNRSYLEPFDSLGGQVVLAVIGTGWALAFASLLELSKVVRPERLLSTAAAGRVHEEAAR